MSQTQAHEIIAAMGYNRRVSVNGYMTVPYVKGSEKWVTSDVISFLERGSFGRTRTTYICRHQDWRGTCQECSERIYAGFEQVVSLDYVIEGWALDFMHRVGLTREEKNEFSAIPAKVKCPVCEKEAVAVPDAGGYWGVIEGCTHSRGINSTGRLGHGAFRFEAN